MQADSLFRIYSMTKPIVTTAAMMLFEEGQFVLDEPLSKYLPAFKDAKVLIDGEMVPATHDFTIGELMSHTAGLTYGMFSDTQVDKLYRDANVPENSTDLAEMVESLGPLPLLNQPGTQWVYSVSVDVLGALIETISGQPLDQFLEQQLFKPLGMKDTFFEVPKSKIHRFGTNHVHNADGQMTVMDRPESSAYTSKVTYFSGSAGLVSTASDYLRYAQMMLNGGELNVVRIISSKTVDLMTANHLKPGMKALGTLGFGLGFGITLTQPLNGLGTKGEYGWGGAAGTGCPADGPDDAKPPSCLRQI